MAKYTAISGFPEWTPGQRRLEQHLIQEIQSVFELSGFAPIETRSVEPLSVLLSKGDDKEIYILKRLHDDETNDSSPKSNEKQLGLHFDLTIPFARYVVEHQHLLNFPFRRYQIQKSWRGERPQEGRFREFYQCDIDLVGNGTLDVSADAEMAMTLSSALKKLPIPPVDISVNNRKVLQGFYEGLGIEAIADTLRIVDKRGKIGPEGVAKLLAENLSLPESVIDKILALANLSGGKEVLAAARSLEVKDETFELGLQELEVLLNLTDGIVSLKIDFSIARGLDY